MARRGAYNFVVGNLKQGSGLVLSSTTPFEILVLPFSFIHDAH